MVSGLLRTLTLLLPSWSRIIIKGRPYCTAAAQRNDRVGATRWRGAGGRRGRGAASGPLRWARQAQGARTSSNASDIIAPALNRPNASARARHRAPCAGAAPLQRSVHRTSRPGCQQGVATGKHRFWGRGGWVCLTWCLRLGLTLCCAARLSRRRRSRIRTLRKFSTMPRCGVLHGLRSSTNTLRKQVLLRDGRRVR